MVAIASTETVTITINDIEIQVPKGELIVESVKRLGLEIPIFCYHPRMKPVGMCRMCLVEVGFKQPDGSVRKMPKPQAGCTLPAADGMVIYTDTEMVHRDRKGVLEFLLINHPLDCPICDRGGECPLQNNTIFYGPSTSRFTELKRHLPKAYPLSQYVTLDLERCIQCGRCVRFTEEISGDSQLAFRFRGAQMQPSTFQLLDFESKFSGNVIEICPVGALTSSKYRFRARPWDLETKPFACTECSNHCNVWFDHRGGKFVRMNGRTNEAINEEWTCDKGKFGQDWMNSDQRISHVLIREGNGFAKKGWSEAYELILSKFDGIGEEGAILVGGRQSNEGLFLLRKVASDVLSTQNLDSRWTRHLLSGEQRLEKSVGIDQVQTPIAGIEAKKTIIILGTSLADEQPMAYLRVRKAWFKHGAHVINVTPESTDADRFAQTSVRYKADMESLVAKGIVKAANELGKVELDPPKKAELAVLTYARLERDTKVSEAQFKAIAEGFGADSVLITTTSLLNAYDAPEAIEALGIAAKGSGAAFNCYPVGSSEMACEVMSILPGSKGMNTHAILEACANFRIKALWLVDCNPFELHPEPRMVADALETVDFLVYQGSMQNEAASYASVILPQAAPAEQDGSYTNTERRVQMLRAALSAPGEAKASWRIFAELLMRARPGRPYFNAQEVFAAIESEIPAFSGVSTRITSEGALLPGQVNYQVTHA